MRKNMKQLLAAGCCAALLVTGGALSSLGGVITVGASRQEQESQKEAQNVAPEFIGVWGPILQVTEDRIYLDNISDNSVKGEIAINISQNDSRVLEAVNGYPVALSELKEGDFIYAYLGPAMTMSLPPITSGKMIICKAPADFKVPEYIRVTDVQKQEDGSLKITGNNGNSYLAPADTTILPYLTRQMVFLEEVAEDRTCLIWSDEDHQVSKIVLFAPDAETDGQENPDEGGIAAY